MSRNISHHATLLLFLATALFTTPAIAGDDSWSRILEVRAFYWNSNLSASIRADGGNLKGTDINLANDLGLSETKGVPGADLIFSIARSHKIRLSYNSIAYSAQQRLTTSIIFKGDTYSVGTLVDTDVSVNSTRLMYEYDFFTDEGGGYAGIAAGVNVVKAEAKLITNLAIANSASASVAVPIVAGEGRIALGQGVFITGELAWVGYEKANLFDGSLSVDYYPVSDFGIFAGFRTIIIKHESDTEIIDVNWSGVLIGGILLL